MKTIGRAILTAVVFLALVSCNTSAPLPAKTSLPTEIPPASPSPVPQETTLRMWEDVPIMPNAIEQYSDSQSYAFVVNDLVDNVNAFYQREMAKLGWTMVSGRGDEMQSLMSFAKEEHTIEMTVVLQLDGKASVTFKKKA